MTGTDTGVGKTVLTALALHYLRASGVHALAMKPFCAGGRGDVKVLQRVQNHELPDELVNPYYFSEPLAPLVAARLHRCRIELKDALLRVREVAARCECLLVEGVGGLLVPLGEDFTVIDLIVRLHCEVVVVSANRLGTINHTLLTARALGESVRRRAWFVLADRQKPDVSAATNPEVLRELIGTEHLLNIPFLGRNPLITNDMNKKCRKLKKVLARLFG